MYLDLFGRSIDPSGLANYSAQLNAGLSRNAVVQQLVHSDEHYRLVINAAYHRVLGRAADPSGIQTFTAKLKAGMTDEQLEATLATTAEFFGKGAGTTPQWLDSLYLHVLGRPGDASGEAHWLQLLNSGLSPSTLALTFATSAERESQRIQGYYQQFLGRVASSSEVNSLLNAFSHGLTDEDILVGFLGSPEYFTVHTAP
jgi:hypothetical protein